MTIIGLKEFSQNAGKIAERVAKGERFTVVKRSKPIFEISAPSNANNKEKKQKAWTRQAIDHYRPALKELHNK